MQAFSDQTLYILGHAKVAQNNPIFQQFGQFYIGFVVEAGSGRIVAADASTTLPLTGKFIASLFIGRTLRDDPEQICRLLETRYFGSSQKTILVCFKDAQKTFLRIASGQPLDVIE